MTRGELTRLGYRFRRSGNLWVIYYVRDKSAYFLTPHESSMIARFRSKTKTKDIIKMRHIATTDWVKRRMQNDT